MKTAHSNGHRGVASLRLPDNLDAERFVLGAILDEQDDVAPTLRATDFSIEKHRLIFLRMRELRNRGEKIDSRHARERADEAWPTGIGRRRQLSGFTR